MADDASQNAQIVAEGASDAARSGQLDNSRAVRRAASAPPPPNSGPSLLAAAISKATKLDAHPEAVVTPKKRSRASTATPGSSKQAKTPRARKGKRSAPKSDDASTIAEPSKKRKRATSVPAPPRNTGRGLLTPAPSVEASERTRASARLSMKAAVPYAAIHRGLAQTGDAVDADVPPSKRRRLTTPATSECGISQSQPSRTRQNTPMVNSARASATPVRIKQRPDPSVTAASPSPDHQDMSMQSQPSHTRQSTPVVDSAPASDTPRRAKQQQDPSAPSASPAPDHPEMSMQSQPSRTLQSTPVVDNALASATPGQQQDPIVPAASPAPDHPEMSMQSQLSQTRQSTPMVDSVPAPVATPGRSTPRPDPTVPAASPAPDHPGMSTPVMTDAESDAVSECSTVDARAAMIEDDSLPEFEMLKMEQVLSHSWVPYDEPGHDAIWLPDELYALLSRMQRTLDVEILARKKWEKYYLEELRKRCRADILIEELQEKIQSLSAPVQTNSTSSTANCAQLSNSQPLPQVPVHFNTTTSTTIKRSRRNSF